MSFSEASSAEISSHLQSFYAKVRPGQKLQLFTDAEKNKTFCRPE